MATSSPSAVLDRVPAHADLAVEQVAAAMRHFADGDLLTAGLTLRQARDAITRSITTIQRRGRA